jgi:hypothetical protein
VVDWLVRNLYAVPAWLQQKKVNPSGWIACVPKVDLLHKAFTFYKVGDGTGSITLLSRFQNRRSGIDMDQIISL